MSYLFPISIVSPGDCVGCSVRLLGCPEGGKARPPRGRARARPAGRPPTIPSTSMPPREAALPPTSPTSPASAAPGQETDAGDRG